MIEPKVDVGLYTQHLNKCGQLRSVITAMKSLIDQTNTRQNLVSLHHVAMNLIPVPEGSPNPPVNGLVHRIDNLSRSIQELEKTLADIEDAIRGTLLYPIL